MTRPNLPALVLALVLAAVAPGAAAGDDITEAQLEAATGFAARVVEETYSIMRGPDRPAAESERVARFHDLMTGTMAMDVLARFVLGSAAADLSQADQGRFAALFPGYITQVFAEQFRTIADSPPQILGARTVRGDIFVSSRFEREDGTTLPVDWRIRPFEDTGLRIIDLQVRGVSFMLIKREEFSSAIPQQGLDAVLALMRRLAGPLAPDA